MLRPSCLSVSILILAAGTAVGCGDSTSSSATPGKSQKGGTPNGGAGATTTLIGGGSSGRSGEVGAVAGNPAVSEGGRSGGSSETGGQASGTAGVGSEAKGGEAGRSGGSGSGGGGTPGTGGNPSRAGAGAGGAATGGAAAGTAGAAAGAAGHASSFCPGGTYPAPDLTKTAALVTTGTTSGQFEGAVWMSGQGVVLFSDMNTSAAGVVPATIQRLTPPGTVALAIADSGSNGLAVDANGTLFAASQKVQGIVSFGSGSTTPTTVVDKDAAGHHFNCPNDLTLRSDGTLYFTDPDYQLGGRTSETGIKGVYRLTTGKQVVLVDGTFGQPNGVTLSPDETRLYVADTSANKVRVFTVAADGSTSGRKDFASLTSPDGGAVDCAGNLYWASNSAPGKVIVFAPDGTQLGSIAVGTSGKPTNVAFGGTDHKTLYVTVSPGKLYSVTMNIPGYPY